MALFSNIGPTEIILILLLAVLFFGAKKLPELARALGRSMKEFKKATREISEELEETGKDIKEIVKEPDKVEKTGEEKPSSHAG